MSILYKNIYDFFSGCTTLHQKAIGKAIRLYLSLILSSVIWEEAIAMTEFSKSKIDQLGKRLKDGRITEDDIRLLDGYRRSFGKAYGTVIDDVRQKLELSPTGRPA